MKKIILAIVIVFTYQLSAQEQTLFSGKVTHGGYGGPEVKFTQIDENLAVLVGGKGGWIINHQFVIGGGGYGLVNNIEAKVLVGNERPLLSFGYGGLYLEYIQDSDKLLHYTFAALIGGGTVSYHHRGDDMDDNDGFARKNFFVVEPAANAEVNIASFFRVNLGVSYRLIPSAVNFDGFNEENLSGISANLTLKFGAF